MENTQSNPKPKRSKSGFMLYPVYFNDKLVWVTIPGDETEDEMEQARR